MSRHFLISFALVLSLPSAVWAQSSSPAVGQQLPKTALTKGKWEYLETKEKIALSRKLIGDNGLFAVRGETIVKASIEKVAGVIYDESRWAEWTNIISAKLLERYSDNQKRVYQAFGMPVMISDRDVVYTFGVTRVGEMVFISGHTKSTKGTPPTIGVRMSLVGGNWYLTPAKHGHTKVVLEVLMDPKGYLPVWFVNIAQRDYPVNTLSGLRKQSLKSDVRPLPTSVLLK